jgi:membrane-bound ClpP family serine protease
VLLVLLSRGGSIEPAYQISKLCKTFTKGRFVVVVPRHAKSAATLIAICADEIHIGPLGQLGPIDPQLGGLPALGVSQALKRIASVSEEFPKSADMFARYLQRALTVEQIGYCDRIAESAIQYAERLLLTKPHLQKRAPMIARELVHEYKDHGFAIDVAEAKTHLGTEWIRSDTKELQAAEEVYKLFDQLNWLWLLDVAQSKRLLVLGGLALPSGMMIMKNRRDS